MIRHGAASCLLLFACGAESAPAESETRSEPPRDAAARPLDEDGGKSDAAVSDGSAGPACAPDGSVFWVTPLGDRSYYIDAQVDPTLTLCRGSAYTFRVKAPYHPFFIKSEPLPGSDARYDEGVTNNGEQQGDITFAVPPGAPDLLHYICAPHPEMTGKLVIR